MEASNTGTGDTTQVGETAASTDSTTATVPELTDEQKGKIEELDALHSDGVITDEQYDTAKAKLEAGEALVDSSAPPSAWGNTGSNLPPGPTVEETAAAAAAQSPAEPQVVPEVRPQGFTGAGTAGAVSEASKRLAPDNTPHGPEEIAAANSDANKQAAIENSQTPNLEVGQRVQITGDHSEAGRMAYVTSLVFKDGLQELLSKIGTPARRFAEVLEYVLITRDGRSDTLTATPEQVTPLEVNEGWGRGSI